jgi:zinc protease
MLSMKMFDLPADYLRRYREHVNDVSIEAIQRVAQQNVTPDRAAIVIVGDAAAVLDQAKSYSEEVEIYDTEGNRKQ